jgi:hypothetical protein
MTPVIWTAIGITIGTAVLHGALGLRRPLDRTYLSFACLMALLAIFLVLQADIYTAASSEVVVETTRRQLAVVHAFIAGVLVFVPSYTRVAIPRAVMTAYGAGLAGLFVINLLAPYGLWYSGPPEVVHAQFYGEPYSVIIAQPMGPLQFAYVTYAVSLLILSCCCAVKVIRRGERERGLTLAIAFVLILLQTIADVVRDSIGGTWPYLAELGAVTWGMIMSVQLAHEYRKQARVLRDAIVLVEAQSRRLTSILQSMRSLEQNMAAPLERLETGVAALAPGTGKEAALLARLRRAVTRLREFSRSQPRIHAK